MSNGELIRCAEKAGYRILVTCDQNVRYQQNMAHRQISVVVPGWNIWPSIKPKIAEIVAALRSVQPGAFEFMEIAPAPKKRRLGGPPI